MTVIINPIESVGQTVGLLTTLSMTTLLISDASLAAALASSPVLMLCRMFVTDCRTAAVVFMSSFLMRSVFCGAFGFGLYDSDGIAYRVEIGGVLLSDKRHKKLKYTNTASWTVSSMYHRCIRSVFKKEREQNQRKEQ